MPLFLLLGRSTGSASTSIATELKSNDLRAGASLPRRPTLREEFTFRCTRGLPRGGQGCEESAGQNARVKIQTKLVFNGCRALLSVFRAACYDNRSAMAV